ncbi:MAG: heparinase II/III-family protein [Opitutaceae bacterium]|jgi:hypothetical protein|nr:heparinase II/III-family protein [Opitutaceae bacterium]
MRRLTSLSFLAVLLSATASTLFSRENTKNAGPVLPPIDPARVAEIAGWLSGRTAPAFYSPPFADRAFWMRAAAAHPPTELEAAATKAAKKEPPPLTEELYEDFRKTGRRGAWEKPHAARTERLGLFLFAEGIASDGRHLPHLERELAEPTWAIPPHAGRRATWHDAYDLVDLAAAIRAWDIALCDYLLGDRLSPDIRKRLRSEIRSRITDPYLQRVRTANRRDFWWMNGGNNWNAICNAGVMASPLLLADWPVEERAELIAAFETLTAFFIDGFGDDGFCHEGIGYWSFGYGHYMLGSELIRLATDGRIDLLAGKKQELIATFDVRWQLTCGIFPAFGDVKIASRAPAHWHDFATLRYGGSGGIIGRSASPTWVQPQGLGARLYITPWDLSLPRPPPGSPEAQAIAANVKTPPLRDWFPDGGALVVRRQPAEQGLIAAFKGGHNGQPHNHNDLGSFVLLCDGEIALTDPGTDVYTKDTFGPNRYTSGVMNSFGHPVPRVAGQLQRTGSDARAVTLHTDFTDRADTWEIDLTSAYDVPALERLTRTFVFTRADGGRLEIVDRVRFKPGQPQTFGTALVLLPGQKKEKATASGFRVGPVEISWSADADTTARLLSEDPVHGIVPGQPPRGTRLGLDFVSPVSEATLHLLVVPAR